MQTEPIVIEQLYHSPIDRVWNAITVPSEMRRWFFEQIESFKPEVGFQTQFDVVSNGRHFIHLWGVTEVLPKTRIVYSWKYAGYPGDSFVIWELTPEGNRTKLTLTMVGQESFPQNIPEFTRESGIQGWTFLLGDRLKKYLEDPDH